MGDIQIKNLPQLLTGYLGPTKKVVDSEIVKLPPAGVGSVMLKVVVTTQNEIGLKEKLYAVAKTLPSTEMARKMFNIQVTVKNEIAFYETILPTLRDFQREQGISEVLDCFADFYGGRINLDNSSNVTEDAALLLEDLTASGFRNITRQEGFDIHGAKIILRDLAKFHGTSIALKLKRPEVFENKIKATCFHLEPPEEESELLKAVKKSVKDVLSENEKCSGLAEKVVTVAFSLDRSPPKPSEPFETLVHHDLWVNNTMQKIENGKIVNNKIVDMQGYRYKSCISDALFFLWTSVQTVVLKDDLDYLLNYYHNNLYNTLKELKCDTNSFELDKFLNELKHTAGDEFGHALFFLLIVRGNNVISEEAVAKLYLSPEKNKFVNDMPLVLKESLWFMVLECDKRGWIKQ